MGLKSYQAKRNFGASPEPKGASEAKASQEGGIYVVQKHQASHLHYDFRLEWKGVLKSWAVPKGPSLNPADKRLAVEVEDHPLEYASFEGIIPEGEYGAGRVEIWDQGEWIPEGDPKAGFKEGKLSFELTGKKLKGHWHLIRMHQKPGETKHNWLLIKEK